MNNNLILVIVFIALVVFWYIRKNLKEGAATSPGTLMQLVAKGPQDAFLTGLPYGSQQAYMYGHRTDYPYLRWRAYPYDHAKYNPWWFYRQRYPYLRKMHK